MKPLYIAGLGCRRHCSLEMLLQILDDCLLSLQLQRSELHALASSEHKDSEPALHQLAELLGIPVYFLPAHPLQAQEQHLTHYSEPSKRATGSSGVAEASALALVTQLTGQSGTLLLPRRHNAQATCAIASHRLLESP